MRAQLAAAWTHGSLLRRTLVHVGTFVLGSVIFLGVVSLILVSIAKGVLPQPGEAAEKKADEESTTAGAAKNPQSNKSGSRSKRKAAASPTDGSPAAEKDE